MINGVLNIYKPRGFTSHDVVAKLRGILKQKKIGHTGTLDPEAVGVLPVCLGNATRACELLTDKDKEYVAVVRLGITTDTQDMTGQILQESCVEVTEQEVRMALEGFLGDYDQIPPMYSALKVNGKKLYELARAGKEVERKARSVRIHGIEVLEIDIPRLTIRVSCSKGTYIRTLCHDLGEKLGCGAAMERLERTRSGSFVKEEAITLKELEQKVKEEKETGKEVHLEGILIPTEELFKDYPVLKLIPKLERLIENGNSFEEKALPSYLQKKERPDKSRYRVYGKNDIFMGIYEYKKEEGRFCPFKMFISR